MRIAIATVDARSLVRFRGPLVRELVARGHEVMGIAGRAHAADQLRSEFESFGARWQTIDLDSGSLSLRTETVALLQLRRLLARERIELISANTPKLIAYAGLAARTLPRTDFVPMVTGLGTAFMKDTSPWVRRMVVTLMRAGSQGATRIIFQNRDDAADLRSHHALPSSCKDFFVAGSGVDIDAFAQAPLPSLEGPLRFLFVGRMLEDKGIFELCDAARMLKEEGLLFECVAAGPFVDHPRAITRAAVEQRAQGAVEFVGEVHDIARYLRECHVFVLPSYREGTPRSGLEALAIGRPIVTTDVPGCREIVRDPQPPLGIGRNGQLVAVRNATALARAMGRMCTLGAELSNLSEASRKFAEERFSSAIVARQTADALGA